MKAMLSKRFNGKQDMVKYIDEFETLLAQLEQMVYEMQTTEALKEPLLIARLDKRFPTGEHIHRPMNT